MIDKLQTVAKFLVALAAAIGVFITVVPNGITPQEWLTVVIAFLGSLGVYQVRNKA